MADKLSARLANFFACVSVHMCEIDDHLFPCINVD